MKDVKGKMRVESFGTLLYFLMKVCNKFYLLNTENSINWFFKF